MAQQQVSQTDVLQDLSYLLGETSVPSPVPADRQAFIQRTLERVYRAYDWDFSQANATIALNSNGSITLPTGSRIDPHLDIRVVGPGNGDDKIFQKIPYEQQDEYVTGDYRYWLTGSPGTVGALTAGTTELQSSTPYVTVRYTLDAPTINASITTPFPSSMVLARGALVYYRGAEDPQADISQLEDLFQQELEEIVALQIRNQGDKPAVGRAQVRGTYTGDVD